MTNHPNRSPRNRSVYLVHKNTSAVSTELIASDLTNSQAMNKAKKLAGPNAIFVGHYGPASYAYVGADVTAVVSW